MDKDARPGRSAIIPKEFQNRIGKIRVAKTAFLLERLPEMFFAISFIPVDINWWEYSYEGVYTGYALGFDLLADGEEIPEYVIHMKDSRDDFEVTKMERVNPKG